MKMEQARVGILGGGQLGKMLNYTANQWNLALSILDKDPDFPSGINAWKFVKGDFRNYEDVLAFGREQDIVGVEIEHVNIQALHELSEMGIQIHPSPQALEIIKDKYLQNQFYRQHHLPTVTFDRFDTKEAILSALQSGKIKMPFVQKTRGEGYDGRGVHLVNDREDLDHLLEGPSIVESKVSIRKELAVLTARNASGEIRTYDPVEMVFNDQNMLAYLYAPADIPSNIHEKMMEIARATMEAFSISGLLAIEFFWTEDDAILVNEVAPRPHNSGHHTLEYAVTSQFEQHLRGLLNFPLGNTELLRPAAMLNVLGEPGHTGPPVYEGMHEIMAMENVHVHLYGKPETRPFRKMGHITVSGSDRQNIEQKVAHIQSKFKIISA